MVRQSRYDGRDALVEKGHGGGGVDEGNERFRQLLTETRLQWSQGTKLRQGESTTMHSSYSSLHTIRMMGIYSGF